MSLFKWKDLTEKGKLFQSLGAIAEKAQSHLFFNNNSGTVSKDWEEDLRVRWEERKQRRSEKYGGETMQGFKNKRSNLEMSSVFHQKPVEWN